MANHFSRTAALATALILAPAIARAQNPLPLDPLTDQERATADSVVRADSRVREFVGAGRTRQIHLDFISVKSREAREDVPSARHAEVMYYNYDRDQGIIALVDLAQRRVVDIARVPGRSVPINADEVALAARLALADPRVVRLFGDRMPRFRVASGPATREELGSARIEGLRLLSGDPADPCFRHRCVVLFFRVNNRYVQMNRVVVDLTAQQAMIREGR